MDHQRLSLAQGLRALSLSGLMLAGGVVSAQRTWTVDKLGGPGSDFTQINPAVAAASPGDRILVKAVGTYQPASIHKGVRVVGVADMFPRVSVAGLEIRGVPGDQRASVIDIDITVAAFGIPARMSVTDCLGAVHIEGVSAQVTLEPSEYHIRTSSFVTVRDGRILAMDNAIEVTESLVVLQGVEIGGTARPAHIPFSQNPVAIDATRSRVILIDSFVSGGSAVFDPITCQALTAPTSGVRAVDSDVLVGAGSSVLAGLPDLFPPCFTLAVPAIDTTGGTLTIDPRATLDLRLGHGTATLAHETVPAVLAGTLTRGAPMTLTTYGEPDGAAAVAVSLPAGSPLVVPGLGSLWVDPSLLFTVDVGSLDSTGLRQVSLPIGNRLPPGLPLVFQGLEASPLGFRLTTPSTVAIR